MFGLFGSHRPTVNRIIVPDRVLTDEAKCHDSMTAVVDFVNRMRQDGHFHPAELPPDAMRA